ncbi:MAG: hypothetical protein Ct9H90mP7_0870 [Candidatus Neomarinimicrobiota bacterium]|nr:MAG: hypothetical protein Ct9H90mP7_0870 [Candidatus Neomarinimicrobiota bacterium]
MNIIQVNIIPIIEELVKDANEGKDKKDLKIYIFK